MLASDYSRLGEEIRTIDEAGTPYIHVDIMDGNFVPSINFRNARGPGFPENDRQGSGRSPDGGGAGSLRRRVRRLRRRYHHGTCRGLHHLHRTIQHIRSLGKKAGVALNPATPLSVLDYVLDEADMILLMSVNPGFGGQPYIPAVTGKIRDLREKLTAAGKDTDIEVDGGINLKNLSEILDAGANVIVAGSSVFKGDAAANVRAFLEAMRAYEEKK